MLGLGLGLRLCKVLGVGIGVYLGVWDRVRVGVWEELPHRPRVSVRVGLGLGLEFDFLFFSPRKNWQCILWLLSRFSDVVRFCSLSLLFRTIIELSSMCVLGWSGSFLFFFDNFFPPIFGDETLTLRFCCLSCFGIRVTDWGGISVGFGVKVEFEGQCWS